MKTWATLFTLSIALSMAAVGCSSAQTVKTQAYAKLPNQRTFEHELPEVWKGIEKTFENHKVVQRDPEEVETLEWNKLSKRSLETDWIYSQSRDKYVEYKINGVPRKKNLQMRIRYKVKAERVMGGTTVTVNADEEIEKLKADGASAGYAASGEADPSRANELLEKIHNAVLSLAP